MLFFEFGMLLYKALDLPWEAPSLSGKVTDVAATKVPCVFLLLYCKESLNLHLQDRSPFRTPLPYTPPCPFRTRGTSFLFRSLDEFDIEASMTIDQAALQKPVDEFRL